MFGQQQNRFSFGNNNNAFGSSTTTPAFGSATGATFGGFGQQNQNKSLFSSTTAANPFSTTGTGGLFGGSSTAAPGGSTLFGGSPAPATGTSLFNQQGTSSSFLKPSGPTAFGTSGAFGTGTGLFGATQPQATSNLFGATAATSAASTPTGGLFGSTQPASSLLAATPGSTLFSGGGAFGANTSGVGTAGTKFSATEGTDTMIRNGMTQNVRTKHYCITAMKKYENKSMEELRLEDYASGVKGPKAASQPTAGLSLFGSTATQPQVNTGSSLFGSTAQPATGFSGFTAPATSSSAFSFGAAKPSVAAGGLFGSSQPATSAAGPSLFGATTSAGTSLGFGQTSGGLFGSTVTSQPLFGNTLGQSTGFGAATGTSTAGGLFGTKTSGFGLTTTTASTGFGFGAQPATGGLFGNTSTLGGFGTQPTTAGSTGFGSTGGFTGFGGQPAAAQPFSFGAPAQSKAPFSFNTTSGLGSTSTLGTGLGGFGLTSTTNTLSAPSSLISGPAEHQSAQQQVQQQIMSLAYSPYGDSPLFRNIARDMKARPDIKPTDPAAQKAILASSTNMPRVSTLAAAKVKLQSLASVQAIGANSKSDIFDGLDDDSTFSPDKFGMRKSVKKLVIRTSPSGSTLSRRTTVDLQEQSTFNSPSGYSLVNDTPVGTNPPAGHKPTARNADEETFHLDSAETRSTPRANYSDRMALDDTIAQLNGGVKRNSNGVQRQPKPSRKAFELSTESPALEESQSPPTLLVSKIEAQESDSDDSEHQLEPHPCGVKLTRPDYYTIPSLKELEDYLDDNQDCVVENFTVGRDGYGSVYFPGETNVANLDLDAIVHFRRKEVTIYPDDQNKPAVGKGLNKRAEVTLDCVWPSDKSSHSPVKSPEKLKLMHYQDKIERATERLGAKFIDYRPDTGSWVFEVKHFSKYGLLDDSDEDNESVKVDQSDVKNIKALQEQTLNVQKTAIASAKQMPLVRDDGTVAMDSKVPRWFSTRREYMEGENESMSDEEDIENVDPRRRWSSIPKPELEDMSEDEDGAPAVFPVSHRLAAQCGVAPSNIQRLKASFMDDDDGDDEDQLLPGKPLLNQYPKASLQPLRQTSKQWLSSVGSPLAANQSVKRSPSTEHFKHHFDDSSASVGKTEAEEKPSLLITTRKLTLPEPNYPLLPSDDSVARKPLRIRLQGKSNVLERVPYEESFSRANPRQFLDASCLSDRRCRIGWGPGMVLTRMNANSWSSAGEKPCLKTISILAPGNRSYSSDYLVTTETANKGIALQSDQPNLETMEKALKIRLCHSRVSNQADDSCPRFEPQPGIAALHEYGTESLNDLDSARALGSERAVERSLMHRVLIWELLVALWGSLPEFDQLEELDFSSYVYQNARREAFSRWLAFAASHQVSLETDSEKSQALSHVASVFSHLTARQISEAAGLARKNRDYRLSLLLSQAGTTTSVRNMIHKQLSDWLLTGADRFIDPDRLKLYALLAGSLVWESTSGSVNCCLDLDWKRSLAIHYWYAQSKLNIPAALVLYDTAWSSPQTYAPPPLPLYMEETMDCKDTSDRCHDACYHLLKLYCNKSYPLECLLATASHTADPLDYHMSWHLSQTLMALGYTHLGRWQAGALHTRYADQLESLQLWHWAIFSLLHLGDSVGRERHVKEVLLRHLRLSDEEIADPDDYFEKERFLTEQLRLPDAWIHEIKAIRAASQGKPEAEAWHLMNSWQLNQAHRLVVDIIAPQCISQGDHDKLRPYLEFLCEHSKNVSDWQTDGKMFWDFLTLMKSVDELKQSPLIEASEVDLLRPELFSLSKRLLAHSCPSVLQKLARSIMASQIATALKFSLSQAVASCHKSDYLISNKNPALKSVVASRQLVEPLSQLPLPGNVALSELREVMSSFMMEYL